MWLQGTGGTVSGVRPTSAVSSSLVAAGIPEFQLLYPRPPLGVSTLASTLTGNAPAFEAGACSSAETSEAAYSEKVSSEAVNPETAAEQKASCGEQAPGQPQNPHSMPPGVSLPDPRTVSSAARHNSVDSQPPLASRGKLWQQTVSAYLVADPGEEGIIAHPEGELVGTLSAVQSDPVGSCRSSSGAAPKALGRSPTWGAISASQCLFSFSRQPFLICPGSHHWYTDLYLRSDGGQRNQHYQVASLQRQPSLALMYNVGSDNHGKLD